MLVIKEHVRGPVEHGLGSGDDTDGSNVTRCVLFVNRDRGRRVLAAAANHPTAVAAPDVVAAAVAVVGVIAVVRDEEQTVFLVESDAVRVLQVSLVATND